MAKKALYGKKPHHVRIWTAECTCFEKQYICMMGRGGKNKVYIFITGLCKFREITETSLPGGCYF